MGAFHKESELALVSLADIHGCLIPRLARVVLVGSEEEWQFHILPRLTVLLHKRVVVIARVVYGPRPSCVYADVVALHALGH